MCCETIDLIDGQDESIDILDGKDESLIIQEGNYYGTNDYNKLNNKPQINSVELIGNKTSNDLNLQDKMKSLTNMEIEKLLGGD